MAHLFYQSSHLITLKIGDYYRSTFRSAKHIFAESSTDSARKRELLATDTKNSIMYAHDSVKKEEYAYAAFGHSRKLPSKRTLQGFNGEFIDILLGVYHLGLGYRAYSPDLMRFQSPDSLSPFGKGGTNCYAYCGGDPVNYTDPTGHTLVRLKNGQIMRVGKNSAVALSRELKPNTLKPSTLKRTTSHASALRPNAPRYSATPENHFGKITEPDIFEAIISNLFYQEAAALSNTSRSINSYTAPIIQRYTKAITANNQTMSAARAGTLSGVPGNFSRSAVARFDLLEDINSIGVHGGASNYLRLIRDGRQQARRDAWRERTGRLEHLIFDAD
ncbi:MULTISPECIES: RHS repeat-associated core domain-containing protein [Pseudomonas]|uniref:RHS repeat-associated core domain-containing protein n=1 Tax=Pseudomonas putida TaxID=303 RepID=A0A3M8SQ80_PSEPU|nr:MULTISPECIES: RHS repeat-associated core domain-containing protein [Pseudomonas]MCE0850314.1 RHS repeat-associated core domain-containing protein [Pseudomonas asiatica]MCO6691767.1 RHS repeat-associated core domain-containing protein [Pseudomonas shirazica]RNF82943.1 RHS repeat-associated core domain-containing protein [Pseudomonas putida]